MLYFRKAFNWLGYELIFRKLEKHGFKRQTKSWFKYFWKEHTKLFKFNTKETEPLKK